ncbi:MAG: GNAT family N-acetyltransferase [Tistrella sp.]|uniref:GNAT family N-acetyltransferase n=1 Tax=Tistrella mobilis TaxID=171437 RepID=A0A3B9IFP9_9PROT|nr:GNAT family N-acetyltransferase [Tistrella sp.]MAD39020.1 GNAT family N-acetyltransferase [Tistrella sp.]MBA74749.1 GNAT family N-acetyltransferase [Tistrella sp.]HAE46117.1 GNAT family N-acetyltransferase [Tistrella mobilis]|tara:strand:- start:743 stop:1195 length:453 start_codon:yes stop_codon:yes gene_type:complete
MTVHSASRPHGIAEIDRSRPEEILPLLTRLYPAIPAETIAARLARVAAGDWRCLVMREAGQIVALSGFRIMERICYGRFLYVDHFVTDDTRRSRGAGRVLLDRLAGLARDEGCESMVLDTFVTNARAQKFWFREGFQVVGFHFLRPLGPA